jgi:uncharacterized membrane protein
LLFYLTSSKLTKLGKEKKASLEADYTVVSARSAFQVFGSSLLASILCVFFILYVNVDSDIVFHLKFEDGLISNLSSLISSASSSRTTMCSVLSCLYIAHYACATADTWASEVGILAKSQPRLVTSFFMKAVPPGTNGGMSLLGTVASAAGGLFIGAVYLVMRFTITEPVNSLASNKSILVFASVCGVVGSLVDSLLGATIQATWYSKDKKCIVKGKDKENDKSVILISGWDILSNESVNVLSIAITMLLSFVMIPLLF